MEESVHDTAVDAATSKFSSTCLGYIKDPYLQFFVKWPIKRSPIINRGYYARIASLRRILHRFFSLYPTGQLLNFGAGFDTTYFTLSDEFPEVVHFEIDIPEILAQKTRIINQTPELRAKISPASNVTSAADSEPVYIQSEKLRMIPGNLLQFPDIIRALEDASFAATTPTVFLCECILIYLPCDSADQILKWAADATSVPSLLVSYEQMNPYDAFGKTMVSNLRERGCPLLTIGKYPHMSSQIERLNTLGWDSVSILDMRRVYETFIDPEDRKRVERLEIFDEIEEWVLFLKHYFVAVASVSSCDGWPKECKHRETMELQFQETQPDGRTQRAVALPVTLPSLGWLSEHDRFRTVAGPPENEKH